MSKQIYLIRHGQSKANAEGRVQGWFDSPLSELGIQQARCLALRLAAEGRFYALFTSPLRRATQTAQIIAGHLNCPVNFEADLREYNMGPIAGLTLPEIRERFPARFQAFERNEPLPHLPGAESEADFMARVSRCMDKILRRLPDNRLGLVVSHGGTLNACLRYWLGVSNNNRRPFSFGNASITVVQVNGASKRVIYLNNTCHLATLEQTGGIEE